MHTIQCDYELLDSGAGRKLERFGDVVLSRPCEQALWDVEKPDTWTSLSASYSRDSGWQTSETSDLPASWTVAINGLTMKLVPTPAGQLGVFPETRTLWDRITESLSSRGARTANVLNLFAHSGGATLAAARSGSSVCHVDSSKSMVTRARENASLNGLDSAPIRWIVEDVGKFLNREIRRGRSYDAIILDPPTFGRGTKGEQYRLDRDLIATLAQCRALLSDEPQFVLLTSHTLGVTETHIAQLLDNALDHGVITAGVMELTGAHDVRPVNSGVWARWTPRQGE